MQSHRSTPPGALLALALVLAPALSLPACGLIGARTPKDKNEELNQGLLERLLQSDAVTPVEDFDEDAWFDELERLYSDLPEEEPPAPSDADESGLWRLGEDEEIDPFAQFGKRIWIDEETGFVTKPYPIPVGMGMDLLHMLELYGDFEIDGAVIDGVGLPAISEQRPEAAVLDLRNAFDSEASGAPQNSGLAPAQSIALADWLFVRARPEVLLEVEHYIELFSAEARQIEIEAKVVEVTTSDSLDYGIRPIDESTPIFGLPSSGTLINSIDYSFGNNTLDGGEAIFRTTSVFDGVEFNALVEVLATYENVSIISRPKVAVREGGQADIVNTRSIPYLRIEAINANGTFKTKIDKQEVGVQMYIIPSIVGTDTIVLNIDIRVSEETGTALVLQTSTGDGDGGGSVITVPEISQRAARTIVRLEPGQAVIIGGLISERTAERERKIPILGDIPLLGYLFKSRFQQKQQTNVLFFIRPRILQGAEFDAGDF